MDEPGWAWEECIDDAGAATAAQVAGDTALLACAMESQGPEKPEGSARSSYRKQRRLNEKNLVNTLDAVLPPCVSRPAASLCLEAATPDEKRALKICD
jgi:hypothetical protein